MDKPRGLYDQLYGRMMDPVYRQIRAVTFDEDLGQTGWLTAAELSDFVRRLHLSASCQVLDVACGSGGASVLMAHETGARVVGVDANEKAVNAALERAAREVRNDRVLFRVADATLPLPFEEHAFDAIFCNDAVNHLKDRRALLADWFRMLKPGGRILYTDPVVVTGMVSASEFAARSTIGEFVFVPRGENEMILGETGFRDVEVLDASDNIIELSCRWRDARAFHREALVRLETEAGYQALQDFLTTVHVLAEEGRLLRHAFCARRPER